MPLNSFTDFFRTPTGAIWGAALVSMSTLVAALIFQYGFGLFPCPLCLWQRYALGVGVAFAVLALLIVRWRGGLAVLAGLGFLAEAGIAAFHSGVERKWWKGLESCTPVDSMPQSLESGSLLNALQNTNEMPRCDEIPWDMFGLSMANYNVLISLFVAGLCFWAARRAGCHRLRTHHAQ